MSAETPNDADPGTPQQPSNTVQDRLEKGIPVCAHTCANCRHIDHDIDGAFCALSQDVEQAGIPNPDAANHCGDFDPKR